MKLVRLACLLAAAANILLFAWGRGYLGHGPGGTSEARRLGQQISPERIRILGALDTGAAPGPRSLPAR
ncbi:MAG: hypothetical protein Fur0039_06140 [Rhodocyclaceae bacterium]